MWQKQRYLMVLLCTLLFLMPHPQAQADEGDIRLLLPGQGIERSSIAVADFNGDGALEMVFGGLDGMVYVVDGATARVMWAEQMAVYIPGAFTNVVQSGIAIADLTHDGPLEFVVATGGNPLQYNLPGAVIVFTYVGPPAQFRRVDGWPRLAFDELGGPDTPSSHPNGMPDGFMSTPAVGDIDGDGDQEIIIGGMDRRLHAWHHDGQYLLDWPVGNDDRHKRDTISSPALADIDGDGDMEIFIGTNNYRECINPYLFYAFQDNQEIIFLVDVYQNIASSPAIGDINGDGQLDVVVGTGNYSETGCGVPADGHKVYAWDMQGHDLPGWPQSTAGNMETSPALGDIDGDGDLEVVIGCYDVRENSGCKMLYAWHGDGQTVSGFPVQIGGRMPVQKSPILVDIDGHQGVDMLFAIEGTSYLTALDNTGRLIDGGRYQTDTVFGMNPVVADIDNDGLMETVIAGRDVVSGQGVLHIWQERASAYGRHPWPMFHQNSQRTGVALPLSPLRHERYIPVLRSNKP